MKLADENFDDSRARRLFPGDGGRFREPWDYNVILGSFGDVLAQVDDDDYSGDTRVLLKKDGLYGFLNFGWGSCSGCDGLQSCGSYPELEEFIRGMERDVKWFPKLEEAKAYISSPERRGSYYYHQKEWAEFISKVEALEG